MKLEFQMKYIYLIFLSTILLSSSAHAYEKCDSGLDFSKTLFGGGENDSIVTQSGLRMKYGAQSVQICTKNGKLILVATWAVKDGTVKTLEFFMK